MVTMINTPEVVERSGIKTQCRFNTGKTNSSRQCESPVFCRPTDPNQNPPPNLGLIALYTMSPDFLLCSHQNYYGHWRSLNSKTYHHIREGRRIHLFIYQSACHDHASYSSYSAVKRALHRLTKTTTPQGPFSSCSGASHIQ